MQQAAYGVGAPELYILGAAWLLFAFAFFSRRRLGRLREMAGNRRSLIGLALQVTGFLIVRIAARPLHAAFLPFGLLGEMAAIVIASGIFALSIWLTHAAVRALGKQWSLAARVVEAHELIKDGPYAYLRHPIYTAMMGMLIGTAVLVSIWQAFLLGGLVFLAGTFIRIRVEEELMVATFGDSYLDYRRSVPALLPAWPRAHQV